MKRQYRRARGVGQQRARTHDGVGLPEALRVDLRIVVVAVLVGGSWRVVARVAAGLRCGVHDERVVLVGDGGGPA